VPKPNVVEVVGRDSRQSKETIQRLYKDLGELFALKEMRDREEGK
jgi:hypothetical protein